MAEPAPFHRECCSRMLSAIGDEGRTTLALLIKPPGRRRKFPLYQATLYHDEGHVLASCRHEFDPFPTDNAFQRLIALVHAAAQ